MRVRYFVICLRSSRSIGSSCVSCWRASVDVVRKHPVVVFIASRCIEVRLFTCEVAGEFRVSSGLYQTTAAYWVLGLITAVYSLLTYLKGAPHVALAMLDIARANFVPFLITCSMCERYFRRWSNITPR